MINHDLFLIENKNNYDVYFVPPFMDADYKIKNNKYLSNLNDNFSLIFLKAQSSQELKIENNLKKKLRLLSLISLLLLLLIMFNKKLKIYKQDIIKMLK